MKKMEAFIKKEADEKANEIRLKAEEEYEIEKASIVRSEINAIDALYETKFKKAALAQQIAKSTIANKSRLKVLAAKQQILEEIFDKSEEQLKKLASDSKKYTPILTLLLEEALLALLEPKVNVKVRKLDLSLAKEVASEASKNYTEKSGKPVEIVFDEADFLDSNIAGGVVVSNESGKIEINNTLEERLALIKETGLPAIRLELFGISKTRKFFD